MARWRPPPLVADSLLAVAVAVLSLALAGSGRSSGASPAAAPLAWSLSKPPDAPQPGRAWDARIVIFAKGAPADAARPPVLVVQNVTTGSRVMSEATPTGTRGSYRARVVFPDAGEHAYAVVVAGDPAFEQGTSRGLPVPLALLTLLATLPLAVRRRYPLPVLGAALAGALTAAVAFGYFPFLGSLIALYTVALHVGRPRSLLAAGAIAAALPLTVIRGDGLGFWEAMAIYAVFAAAWLLGDNLRARRERRRATVGRAAAEEQARVGRELHDIIGHSVSVMTIQAAAAGDAFDARPDQAREALRAIETTGRETLSELRRLLAGDAAAFAPSPGLDRLDALVERVRAAGLAVEVTAPARAAELPPSVELSAYRIVQEALTNTLKHAHASTARVDVRQTNGSLEIAVVDNGRGDDGGAPGHGIIGMRERAAMFGGSLSAGPAPGGGFAVHASIPLGEPAS